ncbi:MAG: hypothetical protein Q4C82_06095 [Eubacteriales bacterium]|nr:hypothetical protein [Eubacteriales bacterium]
MYNRKYYSFERNNYYYGKLLTSKDFENEQGYMNDKRRLVNRTLHGFGIVYGMDVTAADDSSVILQSGMALDASGREIVVPRIQVLKLSTVEGYSSLKTETACLGIAYAEEDTDPVYAVMDTDADGDGRRYNRKRESFRLFLKDRRDCLRSERSEDQYLASSVLYQDEDLCITQYLPTFLTPDTAVRTRTEIRKLSHTPCVLSFSCQVSADGLTPSGVRVGADNLNLEYGGVSVIEQVFRPEDYVFGGEDITVRFHGIRIDKSGAAETAQDVQMKIAPVEETVLEHVRRTGYQGTLDVDLDRKYDEKLWIAQIRLIRSENHSMIDRVERPPFGQYVSSTEQLMTLELLHEYLIPEALGAAGEQTLVTGGSAPAREPSARERRADSSGVFEMSLGGGGEVGRAYFSDEIMHGLGSGPVYVEIGVEYISRDPATRSDKESIILGDGGIFAADDPTDGKVLELDRAVKILPDRGTFIVGVRPRTKLGRIGLRIRWYAFKPEDLEQRVYSQREQKGCIMVQPDTVVLPPKGSVHISPVFINMPEETLTYTLLDPEGGKIDNNGMYTAPAQEGVYEIKIEALGNPEIFTHAFVIVSQKKADE